MTTLKIIHTADVHIKEPSDEGFKALSEILEKGEELGASAVLISGDLFESDTAAQSVRPKLRELFESHPKIRIVTIPGNHDENSYGENLNYGSNVVKLSQKPYESVAIAEGVKVYGIPFARGGEISAPLKAIAAENSKSGDFPVVMVHGTLIDRWLAKIYAELSKYEDKTESDSFLINADDLSESALPLILLGHYHGFVEKSYGKTLATYSGSPKTTSIKNAGKRRANIIEIDRKLASFTMTSLFLSSTYNITADFITFPGGEEKTISEMESFGEKNADKSAVLELKLSGYTGKDENEFQKEINGLVKSLKARFVDVRIGNMTSQISALKENPTASKFLELWEERAKGAKTDRERKVMERALELALGSFEEALIKSKGKR